MIYRKLMILALIVFSVGAALRLANWTKAEIYTDILLMPEELTVGSGQPATFAWNEDFQNEISSLRYYIGGAMVEWYVDSNLYVSYEAYTENEILDIFSCTFLLSDGEYDIHSEVSIAWGGEFTGQWSDMGISTVSKLTVGDTPTPVPTPTPTPDPNATPTPSPDPNGGWDFTDPFYPQSLPFDISLVLMAAGGVLGGVSGFALMVTNKAKSRRM